MRLPFPEGRVQRQALKHRGKFPNPDGLKPVSSKALGAYPSQPCYSPFHTVVMDAAVGATNSVDVPIDDPNPNSIARYTHGGAGRPLVGHGVIAVQGAGVSVAVR